MVDLRALLEYAIRKEFAGVVDSSSALGERVLAMLKESRAFFSTLAAHWLRVGFVQGNLNSDNCLISGRTMDYGPFGFIDRFQVDSIFFLILCFKRKSLIATFFKVDWQMWVGGGSLGVVHLYLRLSVAAFLKLFHCGFHSLSLF